MSEGSNYDCDSENFNLYNINVIFRNLVESCGQEHIQVQTIIPILGKR